VSSPELEVLTTLTRDLSPPRGKGIGPNAVEVPTLRQTGEDGLSCEPAELFSDSEDSDSVDNGFVLPLSKSDPADIRQHRLFPYHPASKRQR
jgi:hypothetical protein